MNDLHYDLCVIGGGINGAGIARDAAGRGLTVLLVEENDLGGATSSASTKLIHGGLRYLEHREFGMVREALKEREILLRNAPHLISPIECVLLQDEEQRPEWLTRIGLWVYDHIGGRKSLPNSRVVKFESDTYGKPLLDDVLDGIIYYDCYADDTRLVVLNAVDAAARNARILTNTRCENLGLSDGRWCVTLRDIVSGEKLDVSASMVVNATGPWVGKFLDNVGVGDGDPDLPMVRLVKGSHIILPKQYEGSHAYVLQQPDNRIVFVAPYQGKYTLVGTTEEDFEGDPRDVRISDAEMAYLCEAVNCAFAKTVLPSNVVFTFSGVRPLLDDGEENASEVSRDYTIYHHNRFDPPLLSVFGGKLTTYRALSEAVVDRLMAVSGRVAEGWTADAPLTGGDFAGRDVETYSRMQRQMYPWLPLELLQRYVTSYGTRMDYFLYGADSLSDLGMHYGDQVFKAEVDYLVSYEWALSAEDILWRRSKLGLHVSDETVRNIEAALAA